MDRVKDPEKPTTGRETYNEAKLDDGRNALLAASAAGRLDVVNLLLERGASINLVDAVSGNTLHSDPARQARCSTMRGAVPSPLTGCLNIAVAAGRRILLRCSACLTVRHLVLTDWKHGLDSGEPPGPHRSRGSTAAQ